MLTESLIEQLEGTPEARQTAIDGLVRLGSERDSSTEYREVEIALNRAFDAPEAERSLHRRMSIIKIMVHLFSPRAITMVNEAYAHGDRQLADMFRAGVTLANLEKISWPSDDELRNTEIQLSLMGNIGAKYLVETKRPAGETLYRSHDHLRAARPEEADFYMMMHYLAIAATVQTRLDLFDGKQFRWLIAHIIDQTEVDAAFGETLTRKFKAGANSFGPKTTAESLIFTTTGVLAQYWFSSQPTALRSSEPDMDIIERGFSDIVGLCLLDDLGIASVLPHPKGMVNATTQQRSRADAVRYLEDCHPLLRSIRDGVRKGDLEPLRQMIHNNTR